MFDKISSVFRRFPAQNAFCINGNYYSYHDTALRIHGIKKAVLNHSGQNIGIIIYDDIETYASILSVLFAGKTYVPINPHNPFDRNDSIIDQAETGLILTSRKEMIHSVISVSEKLSFIETNSLIDDHGNISVSEISEETNAYILFTSGSTGVPKGVPIRYKNLGSFVNAFFALGYAIDETDRFLQMFDLTFDLSIMSYLIPLTVGACVYTVPAGDIKFTAAYTILEDYEITVALMVPSILSFLHKYYDEIRLPKMKYSLFCGEALYTDLTSGWANCVPNALIQNVYGPTEATIFCLTYNWHRDFPNKDHNGILCIGKPMQDILAIVADNQLKQVADEVPGELCLSGGQLTAGYIKNPEKNKEAFFKYSINGAEHIFYRTGDICFIDKDGDFMFSGRLDNQVKIQGFRVELSEIEHYAREFLKSPNAVAVTSQNESGNTLIHLFTESSDDNESLLKYLKSKIPVYMIPAEIHNLQNFPLNVNGKVDRKALKQMI
jgi:D-alanine--poly(phosphoribitol) ligase subunit 1